jgi:hypothetical protein
MNGRRRIEHQVVAISRTFETSAREGTLIMDKAVIATIRDRRGKIADVVAHQGPDDLIIDLAFTVRGGRDRDKFAPLLQGTIRLLNNGVLYVRTSPDQPLGEVEELLRSMFRRPVELVYHMAGIEHAYDMKRQIALQQPATEPFSRVVDSLNRRLTELGLPRVGQK